MFTVGIVDFEPKKCLPQMKKHVFAIRKWQKHFLSFSVIDCYSHGFLTPKNSLHRQKNMFWNTKMSSTVNRPSTIIQRLRPDFWCKFEYFLNFWWMCCCKCFINVKKKTEKTQKIFFCHGFFWNFCDRKTHDSSILLSIDSEDLFWKKITLNDNFLPNF